MKQTFNTLKIISLAIILSFGLSYAIAWTAPSATPPTGNVSAPINTGSATASQTITGKLTVTATTTTGSLVAGGLGLFASSLTTNEILFPDGTKQATAASPHGKQWFTANGTFSVPAGITKVYLTGAGSGGTGGSGALVSSWTAAASSGRGAGGYGTGSNGAGGTGCFNGSNGGAGGTGTGYSASSQGTSAAGGGGGGGGGGLGQSVYNREVAVSSGQSYSVTLGAGLPTTFGSVFSIAKGGNGGNAAGSVGGLAGANGTQELPTFGASGGGGGGGGCSSAGAGGNGAPGFLLVEW